MLRLLTFAVFLHLSCFAFSQSREKTISWCVNDTATAPQSGCGGSKSQTIETILIYIINGVVNDYLSMKELNPKDVVNVTVLKDSLSTRLYYSRGPATVILVTTRKNKKYKTSKPNSIL